MGDWFKLFLISDNAFRIGILNVPCYAQPNLHADCQSRLVSVIVISKLLYSPKMVYLLSGAKFGFPQRKVLPENLLRKCRNQDWSGLQIRSGLVEGNGVFAQEHFVKNTPLCNYGGVQLTSNYAEKHLLPFEDKCDYVLELHEMTDNGIKHIYLNCNPTGSKTYGQLLNHSLCNRQK